MAPGIQHLVFDQNMSVLEGSLGMLPRRALVAENDVNAARQLLTDAGLARELRPQEFVTMSVELPDTTEDAVLGGRLRLRQPRRGSPRRPRCHPAGRGDRGHAGERVVDLGAGVGAAGLALAARIPGLDVTLVEIDAALS